MKESGTPPQPHAREQRPTATQREATHQVGQQVSISPEEYGRLLEQAKQADHYLRTLADLENTKKRLQREKDEVTRYAAETVVRELLPIMDSLGQALVAVDPSTPPACFASQSEAAGVARPFDSAPQVAGEGEAGAVTGRRKQADIEAIITGVHLIYRQLLGVLEQEGVKRIPTVGERFDPHRHEAVAQVDTEDHKADGTIIEEVQVGYTMHGKVMRPAMVKVAKKTADSVQRIADREHDSTQQDKNNQKSE